MAALIAGSTLGAQNGCSGRPLEDEVDASGSSSSGAATGRVSQAGELAGECATNLPEQSLFDYATNCNAVIGAEVKAFNCDDGTLVPEDHLTGTYPNQFCDRPNVLNHQCDPGSRFQVLYTSDDAEIVAHCRKKNGGTNYGDIAVIQYNKKNGATCFYQSPVDTSNLDPHVPAPTDPDAGKLWKQPAKTAQDQCVSCHDNGPFVRSPYLAQLRNEPKNRLPGTNEGAGPWYYRYQWNQTLPYRFLGNAFQSWKAYSVEIATNSTGRLCTNCHRMGIPEINGTMLTSGTSQKLGIEATAAIQTQKNPHSANSPIWMLPDSITYSATNAAHAAAVKKCAQAFARGTTAPAGCVVGRFAQGSTCTGPAISFTVNGATRGEVTDVRVETDVPLGQCSTPECAGFCYFDTIHGPFWQTSDAAIPTTDPKFRGGGLRIFAGSDNQYHLYTIASPNANTKIGIPGGSLKCMQLQELSPPPSPNSCSVNYVALSDSDGRGYALGKPIAPNGQTLDILNGLIGNVAQAGADHPDLSAVQLLNGISTLNHRHTDPPSPLKIGPLRLEASSFSCQGYSPTYIVRDVYSTSDALVLAASQATKARCFISGITGAWSSTRDDGSTQPYAEIYSAGNGDIRMRVAPTTGNDNVGAYASCVRAQ